MIRNADALDDSLAHRLATHCLEAGIAAAQPERAVRDHVALELNGMLAVGDDTNIYLPGYEEVIVVGAGKAAAGVAATLEDLLGDWLTGGLVVTNDTGGSDTIESETGESNTGGSDTSESDTGESDTGEGQDAGSGDDAGRGGARPDRVEVVEASHPIPDERGVEGARRIRQRLAAAHGGTLVIAVFTGGGSALLPAPAGDVDLADLQTVTDALVESGASIDEINAVRKHCSAVKGGQLARAADPAPVLTLLLSDVVGDDPAVVASGPTVGDPTTYGGALAVLEGYDVDAPVSVRERLERGADGNAAETPAPDADLFADGWVHVLATGRTAVEAARETAADAGFRTLVLATGIEGEAREVAKTHAAVAREMRTSGAPVEPPAVVVSGGETTVTVTDDGRGGPSCEFALSAARSLPEGAVLGSVDTDGSDGTSGAAGALVTAATVGADETAAAALRANDAASYLDQRDALVRTGQTGTNVNDLHVLVVPTAD